MVKMEKVFCIRCQKQIIRIKQDYIVLAEFHKGKEIKKNYFHKICWEDKTLVKRMALNLAGRASKIMDKLEGGEEEIIIQ